MTTATADLSVTQQPSPRKRRTRRFLLRVVKLSAIIYLVLCVLTYCCQDWLMFPAHAYQGTPQAKIRLERDSEQVQLTTAHGDSVVAIFGRALLPDGSPHPDAAHRPTLLYFYGNGGAIAWSMNEFDHFRRLGANVLVPDLVGFGMSSGKPSEANLYATADAAYDYLLQRRDIDPGKIVTVGWSMGGAIAIDLAARRPVAGVATFNAFTSMPEMAHLLLPWLPAGTLCKYDFANERKMATIRVPAFICNGMRDTLVPPTMSDRLARAAQGPVTRVTIDTADHNTIFVAKPLDLFAALQKFVDQVDAPIPR
ncbi:MAG TPA: alpha/beta fold hydrolase [Tepidisphaeraceae bacterium]|nr:alpha/beta fold hydrolase [Tepidisphaeraceae bacterium]